MSKFYSLLLTLLALGVTLNYAEAKTAKKKHSHHKVAHKKSKKKGAKKGKHKRKIASQPK